MLYRIPIYIILSISLFGGLFYTLGVPEYFSVFTEIIIYFLFIVALLSRRGKGLPITTSWYIVVFFILITFFSIIINNSSPTRAIFSLRLIFRFYVFYLCIILIEPEDDFIKKINSFIIYLLVLQFPVIAAKFSKYGISEATMGAYAIHDGSIATTLPISLIFYLSSFYFLYKRSIKSILIAVGYIIFSIVAMKRAVFYLFPVQFILIYYFIYFKRSGTPLTKKMGMFISIMLIIVLVSASILHFNAFLNPDQKVGGDIDVGFAIDFAKKYNAGVDGYGYSYGRLATSERAIKYLWNSGVGNFLLGLGPGFTTESILDTADSRHGFNIKYDKLKIGYGTTSVIRIALEYGMVGVFLFSWLLISLALMSRKLYKLETIPYWKAFAAGSVGFSYSMLFFAFTYHSTTFFGDTMPALYFYAMAIVYVRLHNFVKANNTSIKPVKIV